MKRIVMIFALLVPIIASAAQWTDRFAPTALYLSGEGNYHFRVVGVPAGCPSGWAYLNQADSGSKTYIASLLMAHASGKQIQLFVAADANGYCHILEAQIFS